MIRIAVIEHGKPTPNQREQFKQYASVPDNSRDALLEGCLTNAMLAVQAAADVAILPCILRLTADNVTSGESFRLYQGCATVESVLTEAGVLTDYSYDGERLTCPRAARLLTVNYSNEVLISEADKLMPIVWQYATALYDGETPDTLNKILKQLYF